MEATKGVVTYAFFLFSFYFDTPDFNYFFIEGNVESTVALAMPCEWAHLINALKGRKRHNPLYDVNKEKKVKRKKC